MRIEVNMKPTPEDSYENTIKARPPPTSTKDDVRAGILH